MVSSFPTRLILETGLLIFFYNLYRDDEPAKIQKYFSATGEKEKKVALWKDFALTSVDAF